MKDVLRRLLDEAYAGAKAYVNLQVHIDDVATIEQTSTRASCKAMTRITMQPRDAKKDPNVEFGDHEEIIAYTVETTENGRFIVTMNRPR